MSENFSKKRADGRGNEIVTTPEVKEVNEDQKIDSLAPFEEGYFKKLEGEDGWIATGQENCSNVRYFTILSDGGERLGIVGVYDTEDEKNVTHTVIDTKYRGQRLAAKAKMKMMEKLGLPFLTMTVDLDNTASLRAVERMEGVKRTSDEAYEKEFHKARFEYRKSDQE